jgi:hypothetical protein
MGLILNLDLETNQGPTNKLYIRIDTWRINNTVNEIRYSTTSWLDKSYGDKFLRKYYDDELQNSIGLVTQDVVFYDKAGSDGIEIHIPNLYTTHPYIEEAIEVDVLEEQKVTKEVPYVSFDEEGNEITLYRTVTNKEKVKVGTDIVTKKVIDYSIPLNNLGEFCYNNLIQALGKSFPIDKIEKV